MLQRLTQSGGIWPSASLLFIFLPVCLSVCLSEGVARSRFYWADCAHQTVPLFIHDWSALTKCSVSNRITVKRIVYKLVKCIRSQPIALSNHVRMVAGSANFTPCVWVCVCVRQNSFLVSLMPFKMFALICCGLWSARARENANKSHLVDPNECNGSRSISDVSSPPDFMQKRPKSNIPPGRQAVL